ncbi:uncharacterized protein LOC135226441 [Macrobrachium nipponense]|uniref:uncharacterized protein LOC135226441 n=1 Tax=Macrobrachium nipponense TaxID=159736 RepID=UPI0030C83789
MYMNTRANLGYWSTDNCCAKWSLKTGTLIIGFITMLSQALLTTVGIMAVISCPVPKSNATGIEEADKNLTEEEVVSSTIVKRSVSVECVDVKNATVTRTIPIIECPLLPRPELESLHLTEEYTFNLAVGLFIIYSGIYFILSFGVIIGALKGAPNLLHGWVGFTGMHMVLILADLLYTLAFTTLIHLCTSLSLLVVVLYTWAVVKSFMHTLRNEKNNRPSCTSLENIDETVDGIHMEPIPVQV